MSESKNQTKTKPENSVSEIQSYYFPTFTNVNILNLKINL